MNPLEIRLHQIDQNLYNKLQETKGAVHLLLGQYSSNFPTYTDHSIKHTEEVFKIASELLTDQEIQSLNSDEIYILSMSCLLHDIGMCIPEPKIVEISNSQEIIKYRESHPNLSTDEYIRNVHHTLSNKFIQEEWELLKIPTAKYAKAIGLVSEGHRKVDIANFDVYNPYFFPKDGKDYSCLPYLACVLRIADELDVTNSRTPKLLTKYYMPNNDVSIKEWTKHINTSQRNYFQNKVIFEVDCTDQNIYAALQDQFDKIQNVINYCQKVVRGIPTITGSSRSLTISLVDVKYNYLNFDPKGIKFSFDVQNVVTAFIGEDLYKDRLTSLREAVQNSIDSCRYKRAFAQDAYIPSIKISITDEYIRIEDNATGMDEFIVENYFGRLASSFYEQDKVKSKFEAIGQFGVGVFSYFLLSEYIDIETKTVTSTTLKFRFDKDPKSYFHFYDRTERTTPGTTITMYLKKDLVGTFKFSDIESYIRKIFVHIEIPIQLFGSGSESHIQSLPFHIDSNLELKTRLKLQERKLLGDLAIIESTIIDDDIEGNCGLIVGKNYLDTFKYSSAVFDYESFKSIGVRRSYGQISLSQKGIFVNNYNAPCIDLMIGDINLNKKIKINIDRNEFSDIQDISNIISKFEINILEKIFTDLEGKYKSDQERLQISDQFLFNYFNISNFDPSEEFKNLIAKNIYVKVVSPINEVCSIFNLTNKFESIVLINNLEKTPNYTSGAVIAANDSMYYGAFSALSATLSHVMDLRGHAIEIDKKFYQIYTKDSFPENIIRAKDALKDIIYREYISLAQVNSTCLIFSIWSGKSETERNSYYFNEDIYFNANHHFFKFLINNKSEIIKSPELKKIISSILKYINEVSHNSFNKTHIEKLNDTILPLNAIQKIKKFRSSDFKVN